MGNFIQSKSPIPMPVASVRYLEGLSSSTPSCEDIQSSTILRECIKAGGKCILPILVVQIDAIEVYQKRVLFK
jgi:hypothetical protein